MLDTRSKKMRKITALIIALVVLLPALGLVSLYPQMEKSAHNQIEMYMENKMYWGNIDVAVPSLEYVGELDQSFVNMATEAAYYIHGLMLREESSSYLSLGPLEEYGWVNDYYTVRDNTEFYAVRTIYDEQGEARETQVNTNAEWDFSWLLGAESGKIIDMLNQREESYGDEYYGFLTMEFGRYGDLMDVRLWLKDEYVYYGDCYSSVLESMDQYLSNATYYHEAIEQNGSPDQLVPKNFEVIFLLTEDAANAFIASYSQQVHDFYADMTTVYWDIGALIPVLMGALFVAIMALILPFFKKLQTGWEGIFCMPFEVILVLLAGGTAGAVGMYYVMSHSLYSNISMGASGNALTHYVIGIPMDNNLLYVLLLAVNFLGWAALYFMEYIVVTSFRQFLCGPVKYCKERIWFIRIFPWMKKQLIRLSDYVMDIDIKDKLDGSILKIVIVNGLILILLCCLWLAGAVGVVAYSIILFVLLRKYGQKIREKYLGLIDVTKQMADGNLKVQVEEDLGVLQPLGDELERVQQGFSKAVMEEARSQSMKTELITNVSHDLKTPLTAIITYVDLLKKEDITEEERKSYVATLDQKSQRLKVLIEDLFEVSKAASGNMQMNFMDVDVVNLMKQVRLEMEEKIADSELAFRWNLPEEKVVLRLDGQRTYRVFENLLNNILKYSLPHSRVYIDILDLGSQVQVIFKNISRVELGDDPSHLTERFVRGDASRQTEGSGLGLAIVKNFVELQNGKLDISIDGDLFKVSIVWDK